MSSSGIYFKDREGYPHYTWLVTVPTDDCVSLCSRCWTMTWSRLRPVGFSRHLGEKERQFISILRGSPKGECGHKKRRLFIVIDQRYVRCARRNPDVSALSLMSSGHWQIDLHCLVTKRKPLLLLQSVYINLNRCFSDWPMRRQRFSEW